MSISRVETKQEPRLITTEKLAHSTPAKRGWREYWALAVVLFKLRIVFLLLMAATGGAFIAAGGWPGLNVLLLTWITGGMAAAGASALNQYWERDSDGLMQRTSKRPLVTGQIAKPAWVPVVGLLLILAPSLAVVAFNPALTFFLLSGAFIYVVIYTIWLKPRTVLNVVIGGAAGSAAVLSGSAAAGYWNAPGALVLALILFLWSPFHFWSLALMYRDQYERADYPMLPVKTTPQRASWWVMAHTAPTCLAGLALVALPSLGWLYFIPVLIVSADLFYRNIKLIGDPSGENAKRLFLSSNFYLLTLLVAICVGSVVSF